jgi:hypothetical protein
MFAASVAAATNGIAQVAFGGSGSFGEDGEADLRTMTQDTFEPLMGSVFHFRTHTSPWIPVVLTSVKQSPTAGIPPLTDAFTLTFSSTTTGSPVPQNTYAFRHAGLGSFQLFIVPSGPGVPCAYTAVFTHLEA